MLQMENKERPRTKRLERPTPNLKHPVIGTKKSKDLIHRLNECIEGIDKFKTSTKSDKIEEINVNRIPINRFQTNRNSLKINNFGPKREPAQKCDTNMKDGKDGKKLMKNSDSSQNLTKQEEAKKGESKEEEDVSGWQHFNAQLIPCGHCRRTFFPHRLPIHERSCRGIGVKKASKKVQEPKTTVKTSPLIKTTYLDCNTCGRKYSTTSLTLHELKCRASSSRRVNTGNNESGNELATAWEQFKSQLVACAKCKRKFLADRLEKHEPICKASPLKSEEK